MIWRHFLKRPTQFEVQLLCGPLVENAAIGASIDYEGKIFQLTDGALDHDQVPMVQFERNVSSFGLTCYRHGCRQRYCERYNPFKPPQVPPSSHAACATLEGVPRAF